MASENSAMDPIDPVGPIADEFLDRQRRGEQPTVREYAERYPQYAERIRQLFPMLVAMEEAGADASLGATVVTGLPGEAEGPRLERVGGYRILREVGRGGMGVVYEAEQVALGRHVALKVLPLHAARDGSGLERFRQEARAAARLHHTNIVPVFEVGQDGDAYFYAMQFIQGQPLDQVLDELRKLRAASLGEPRPAPASVAHSLLVGLPAPPAAPTTPPAPASSSVTLPGQPDPSTPGGAYCKSVTRVGVQVAAALDYAHREGVIHRDVKPSNLLLDADGRVWVTDFGLAKTDGTALTRTGDVVGTVRYMAPERFNGWSDPRSDIYSLGLTLYEMLALRPAFDAEDQVKLMQQVLHQEPAPLRRLDPHLPRDLETVIAKAMDKEPSRRYQTAAEFGADLQRFLDDRPVVARRVSAGERLWRWGKRNPALAVATGLTFAALLIATAVSAWFAAAQADSATRERRLSNDLRAAQQHTEDALHDSQRLAGKLDAALKETRGHAARAAVDRAQGLMERGQLHEAMLWLARAVELTPGEDGDLQRYARACFAGLEVDAPALRALWAPHHGGHVLAAAFSADGTKVLTGSEATETAPAEARLWDAVTGQPLTEPLPHKGNVTLVAISPDGQALLTVSTSQPGQSEVRLWDAATGRPLTDPLPHAGPVTAAVCGPGGKTFFTTGGPSAEAPAAQFWEVAGGSATPHELAHAGAVTALAISPNADAVVTGWRSPTGGDGGLRLWDARSGAPTRSKAVGGVATAVAVAADGVVWVGEDSGGVLSWDPTKDRLQPWLYGARGTVRELAPSPAGDLLLVTSENLQTGQLEARLWDRHRGQSLGVALPHEAAAARAAFSPDGQRILTWDQNRPVRAWELDGERRWLAALPMPVPGPLAGFAPRVVRYGADGGTVLTLAVAIQQGASLRLWDAAAGTARGGPLHLEGLVQAAAVSPDGRTSLIAWRREASFWDNDTGKPVGSRLTYDLAPSHLAFSPDGKTVALANLLRLWLVDVATGKAVGPSFPAPGPLADLRFHPDGKSLWLTTSASVRRLDVAGGRDLGVGVAIRGRGFHGLIPGPDGKLLAVLDGTGVALWDTATGDRAEFTIPRWGTPSGVAFTPDGKALLAAEPSGLGAQLWDTVLGKPIGLPIRCPSFYVSGAVRPDGGALAVADGTGIVRLVRSPPPAAGDGADLARRAQALAGLELTAAGAVRGLSPAAWEARAAETKSDEAAPAFGWHLRRGLDRVEAGHWDAALWYLNRHLRARPDDWLALALRARARANLGRYDEAKADFDRSFDKGPAATVFAWHLLATQPGGSDFEDQPEPPPGKPRRLSVAAWFYERLCERDDREAAVLLLKRARVLNRQQHWDRARADYERAARVDPDDSDVLQEVARACLQHKEPDRATDYFLRALDVLPQENGVGAPRAVLALDMARSPEVTDRALRLRPKDRYLWAGRGRYHVGRGEWKEAAADFARAAELSGAEEPCFEHAALLLVLDDEAGYREAVQRLIDRAGTTRDTFEAYVLARTCALAPKSGADPGRVVAWAEQAVSGGPDTAWHLHVLGLALYRRGDCREAVARLEESAKTGWVPVLNWLGLALAHHQLGHAGEARKYLDRATAQLDRSSPATLLSTDTLEAQVLRREAEVTILGQEKR